MTRTELGNIGYLGPCPPQGDHPHRYQFTVFASARTSSTYLHFNMLAKAGIMGLFKRWAAAQNTS
jgi:phosphatidylethanolamine-binding protein (PEBP) family uncharacterized protein